VILETMRLASVVSGVMRRTTEDLELNGVFFNLMSELLCYMNTDLGNIWLMAITF